MITLKMRIIDLLNKIANGEEVPKTIKYKDEIRQYVDNDKDYTSCNSDEYYLFYDTMKARTGVEFANALNDEVEIIEDTPKVQVEMTEKEYNEYLDSKLDTTEEDEKIEKLAQRIDTGLFGSQIKNEIEVVNTINKQANYLSEIVSKINEIIDKINGDSNERNK